MHESIRLYDLIAASAAGGLHLQKEDGSMPEGHNGPWRHPDTPVRTTAHWALLFFKAFLISGDGVFREAALTACQYLVSDKAMVNGYFFCRDAPGKDTTNNLIGQAWAVEPLAVIGNYFSDDRFITFAAAVIKKHRFDQRYFLWYRAGGTGHREQLSRTLNQQMMFAAMALHLGKTANDPELTGNARSFFDHFVSFSRFIEPGLPHHKVFLPVNAAAAGFTSLKTVVKQWLQRASWKKISRGYVSFILYAAALAHYLEPGESFWRNPDLKKWLKAVLEFVLAHFPYGYREDADSFRWAYTPVAFE
ncbi:MAG: hypothetical protein GY950_08940, partial [bacterium]|nr:hypothetical protein [bacterium]